MTARKVTTKHDEIMEKLEQIQKELAERRHLDNLVLEHKELLSGNHKPGFQAIRDKVLSWDNKVTAIILVIVGDIAVRVVQLAMIR